VVRAKPSRSKAAQRAGQTQRTEPDSRAGSWNLRLYIAGDSPRSRSALENLQRICRAHLGENYTVEVVDLKKRPELAKIDQILAVPTLIRKIPEPMKRVIGDLSNAERALLALDLASPPSHA
jgi:circadian clock protein KaiB